MMIRNLLELYDVGITYKYSYTGFDIITPEESAAALSFFRENSGRGEQFCLKIICKYRKTIAICVTQRINIKPSNINSL